MFKFIAGNHYNHAIKLGKKYLYQNKFPIINYAVENTNNTHQVYLEYDKLIDILPKDFSLALKLSSFDFKLNYISTLIMKSREKKINMIIDAEDSDNNEKYQKCIDKIIYYDQTITNVPDNIYRKTFKTYQMYRKDSFHKIKQDMDMCQQLNIPFNAKLVRGAYWNSEHKNGELFTHKNDTDQSYNNAILEIYHRSHNQTCDVILATHNQFSARLGRQLNKENIFSFAHLQGMRENFYHNFDSKVYVYIPYGPYHQMIPYLSRRLYENLDIVKHAV